MVGEKRVKITYESQVKTCARCNQIWDDCPGNGVPEKCEEGGGNKTELSKIWHKFIIDNDPIEDDEMSTEESEEDDEKVDSNRIFEISGFPAAALPSDVLEWLTKVCKIPVDIDDIKPLASMGRWKILNLTMTEMKEYKKKIFGKKIGPDQVYASIYVPSTPQKVPPSVEAELPVESPVEHVDKPVE